MRKTQSERKKSDDESIKKLENEVREVLQISNGSLVSKNKSLDEPITKSCVSSGGQMQARERLSDSKLLQTVSGGRALQGVLLTKYLCDQLEARSQLLGIPEDVLIVGASRSYDKIMYFSSSHQEDEYNKTVDILGESVAVSIDVPVYGSIAIGGETSRNCKSRDEKESKRTERRTYLSTMKFSTMHVASYAFTVSDLKLSADARDTLKYVLCLRRQGANYAQVQKACEHFFHTYGSHVTKGPLHFGGNF